MFFFSFLSFSLALPFLRKEFSLKLDFLSQAFEIGKRFISSDSIYHLWSDFMHLFGCFILFFLIFFCCCFYLTYQSPMKTNKQRFLGLCNLKISQHCICIEVSHFLIHFKLIDPKVCVPLTKKLLLLKLFICVTILSRGPIVQCTGSSLRQFQPQAPNSLNKQWIGERKYYIINCKEGNSDGGKDSGLTDGYRESLWQSNVHVPCPIPKP